MKFKKLTNDMHRFESFTLKFFKKKKFLIQSNIFIYFQISWIRKHDLAILTSNTFVYTSDARFSVIHIFETHNWDLRIKPVSLKDSGLYECQVNTEPKINFPVFLDVISKGNLLKI